MHHSLPPRILIIAGSDSGGGAGIQGDIKTVSALGGYAMTAITALTAQNTLRVSDIYPVPPEFVAEQIRMCLSDIGADAIKTGMLHSAEVIAAIVKEVEKYRRGIAACSVPPPPCGEGRGGGRRIGLSLTIAPLPIPPCKGEGTTEQVAIPRSNKIPLVVDPVMVAKGGSPLLEAAALEALKTRLIPMATIITPNLPEAELLLGRKIPTSPEAMTDAAQELLTFGSEAVLLKGGHAPPFVSGDKGEELTDILVARDAPPLTLTAKRINTRHTHGTGCTFASAIATGIGQKLPLSDAVARAHAYVQEAIRCAPGFGGGHGPLGHSFYKFNEEARGTIYDQ